MGRITLWGMYQYDPTLFDNVQLPSDMDKDTLINEIMSLSGQLYPYHQVPGMFKHNAEFWFKRNKYNFEMMFEALNVEYNPIENYDRKEDSTETPDITKSLTSGSNASSTTGTTGTSSSSGTNTGKTSAYDTEDFSNMSQDSNSDSSSTTMNSTSTDTNSLTSSEAETGTRTFTSRVHGNVGVTTSQQMIEAELKLRQFDLYKQIAMLFEHELLVQVY